jgi:DNA-nicking Smr family endonuclease
MTRRRRTPTEEELALWEKVTDSVAPLAAPPAKPVPAKPVAAKAAASSKAKAAKPAPTAVLPPPPAKPKGPPPLHALDRRTRGRLSRGSVAIDRRVDLHGLTQAAAHARLGHFLRDARDEGAKIVLVITGKGKPTGETAGIGGGDGGERGILRRMVPVWLAAPDLRAIVIGFDEAGPAHGGAGALYVRLRRADRGG